MNFPLLVAGSLALLGAGIHGVAGEALVVRRLSPGGLQSSPFGSPGMTKTMIRAAWHMTTVAFLTVGSALVLSGSVFHGDTARGIGLVAAGESTGFAGGAVAKPFVSPLAELTMLPRRQLTAQGYRPLGQLRSVVLSEWRRP